MRYVLMMAVVFMSVPVQARDQPLLIVTPQGAWKIDMVGGVPQPPVQFQDYAIIVQGFGEGDGGGGDPPPPVGDPVVKQIAALSVAPALQSKAEATAAAAFVNSLSKAGLSGAKLTEAMLMTAGMIDAQLKSGNRIQDWSIAVTKVSSDPAKLIAGLVASWQVDINVLGAIQAGVTGEQLTAAQMDAQEAFDIAAILQIIMMIIEFLRTIGWI